MKPRVSVSDSVSCVQADVSISRRRLGMALAASALLPGLPALAQEGFPSKPITIVAPFTPGGHWT